MRLRAPGMHGAPYPPPKNADCDSPSPPVTAAVNANASLDVGSRLEAPKHHGGADLAQHGAQTRGLPRPTAAPYRNPHA
ncbi:hypothetical protein M2375_004186 [Comamonas sp. BIGb0152]|nr:hypothetical protein [Comamonas sp. BIGb0152]